LVYEDRPDFGHTLYLDPKSSIILELRRDLHAGDIGTNDLADELAKFNH